MLIYKSTNIFLQNLWTSRGFFLRQRPSVFPLSTKGPLPSSPNHYDQTCGHEPKVPCTSLQCLSTNKKEKLGDLTKQGQQSDANHVLGRFWLNMLNIKNKVEDSHWIRLLLFIKKKRSTRAKFWFLTPSSGHASHGRPSLLAVVASSAPQRRERLPVVFPIKP